MPTAPTPARTTASVSDNEAPANATATAPGANTTLTNPQGRTTRQSMGGVRAAEATSNQEATPPNGGDAPEPAASKPTTRQGSCQAASRARATKAEGRRMRNTRKTTTPLPTAVPTTQNVELTSAFVMAPYLCDAIFNEKSSDLLELIILTQDAATEFDARMPVTGAQKASNPHLQRSTQLHSQTGPLRSISGS